MPRLAPTRTLSSPRQSRLLGATSLALLLSCGLMLLMGCAGPRSITADVSSQTHWPPGRLPGTYAFERVPSQQRDQQNEQDEIERAALPALLAAGFEPAAEPQQAQVFVQVSAQIDPRPSPYGDFYGPRWHGAWGWGPGGVGLFIEPPWWELRVAILMRDRLSQQTLYESRARLQRPGNISSLISPLFYAALQDFPYPAVSPRPVTVQLQTSKPSY